MVACAALTPARLAAQSQTGDDDHGFDPQGGDETRAHATGRGKPKPIALVDVVRANLEPAYIAYPIGISGLAPLVFESNVVAHFMVNRPEWPVAFVLSPKILVRMFNQTSAPVKTPSYMPRVTAYFWFERYLTEAPAVYGSIVLSHHSNGQAGSFYNSDGTVNYDTGSFSTNYFEFTAYGTGFSGNWFGWSALSLEWHPGFNENRELRGTYGRVRLHIATTLLADLPLKGEISLRLGAILDKFSKYSHTPFVRELERFPISLRYTMMIPGIDLGLFVGYYFGHDYYNIYYTKLIHTLQLGISGSVAPNLIATEN